MEVSTKFNEGDMVLYNYKDELNNIFIKVQITRVEVKSGWGSQPPYIHYSILFNSNWMDRVSEDQLSSLSKKEIKKLRKKINATQELI